LEKSPLRPGGADPKLRASNEPKFEPLSDDEPKALLPTEDSDNDDDDIDDSLRARAESDDSSDDSDELSDAAKTMAEQARTNTQANESLCIMVKF